MCAMLLKPDSVNLTPLWLKRYLKMIERPGSRTPFLGDAGSKMVLQLKAVPYDDLMARPSEAASKDPIVHHRP